MPFTSVLAFLLATQVPVDQPQRLRTVLANGAVVLVERVPKAKSLVVDLFTGPRGCEETPATNGYRHLLEHLVALGRDEDLDRRLESSGGFLNAKTFRDAMSFEFNLPPDALDLGLRSVGDLLAAGPFSADAIKREAEIIREEAALRDDAPSASAELWSVAFGSRGLDPLGDAKALTEATPESLEVLRKKVFSAPNLALVISGDVDLDRATSAARALLSTIPGLKGAPVEAVPPSSSPVVEVDLSSGKTRGVAVPSFRDPATAATLAAAFAISTQIFGSEVVYTPSARGGLVIVSAPGGFANLSPSSQMFGFGRAMAAQWIRARLSDQVSGAAFRGMLLVQERDLRPETLTENLESLDYREFQRAYDLFAKGGAAR